MIVEGCKRSVQKVAMIIAIFTELVECRRTGRRACVSFLWRATFQKRRRCDTWLVKNSLKQSNGLIFDHLVGRLFSWKEFDDRERRKRK